MCCLMTVFLTSYAWHCIWVTSEAYSSPSIVLSARGGHGDRIIFDDFRESYYWLRMNTAEVGAYELSFDHKPDGLINAVTCVL